MSLATLRSVVVVLAAALVPMLAFGQAADSGAMIVIVNGDDAHYHQPGCPVVAKAGSKVRVAKTSEATRKGLKQHPACADGGGGNAESASTEFNSQKVYTQADDNKYHLEDCEKLVGEKKSLTLEEAGQKLWPCPVCKPPIRKRKSS